MYKDFHFQNKICVLFSMPFISLFNHLTRRDGLVKKWIFYFFNALRKCFHYLIKFHLLYFSCYTLLDLFVKALFTK